jgi:tetrahydromethanopterin S-methyltransferase subunit F
LTAKSILQGVEKIPRLENLHIACASAGLPGIATGFQAAALLVEKLTGVKV